MGGNINLKQTSFAGILSALTDVDVSPSDQDVLTWDEATSKWIAQAVAGGGDVTAGATLTDNRIVRGDVAAKAVQTSGITIDNSNNVSGMGTLGCGAITGSGSPNFFPAYNFISSIHSLTCNVWGYSCIGKTGDSTKLISKSAAGSIYPQAIIMGGLGGGIRFVTMGSNPGLNEDILIATYERMKIGTDGIITIGGAGDGTLQGASDLWLEAGARIKSENIRANTTVSAANVQCGTVIGTLSRVSSGKKYKDKIKDLELDSSLIYNLRPVSFNSKCSGDDKNRRFVGLIADEIKQVYPEIVQYNEKHEAEGYDNQMLMTLMLSQLQEINKRVGKLEGVTDE